MIISDSFLQIMCEWYHQTLTLWKGHTHTYSNKFFVLPSVSCVTTAPVTLLAQ